MNPVSPWRVVGTILVVLVVISTAVLGVGASPVAPAPSNATAQITASMPGPQVILIHDDRYIPRRVPPPPQIRSGVYIQTANFTVNWNPAGCDPDVTSWPSDAKSAFQYTVSIWSTAIHSSQTIVVDACWRTDMASNVLGSAGTTTIHRDGGLPVGNTWYPAALANALMNSDLNGSGTAEIEANFNSTFDWYYGTDGNTPGSKVDFASVVLHEIGHGLGFLGFGSVIAGVGSLGYLGYPSVYDRFTEDGAGAALLSYTSPSTALGNALTGQVSGGVYFDGPNANAANGGRVKLYSPSSWSSGSSYSHLDETFNGTENSLMTYSLGNGESEHSPGPVMLGMFQDMGWSTPPDLRIVKRVADGGLGYTPGDPVTFTLSIENIGGDTAAGVVVTDTLSSDILTPSWDATAGISLLGGTYVWSLPDLAAGASGVITIYGTISATLPTTFTIWNSASVGTSSSESETSNNSSTALVGGERVYLPLTVRNY